LVKRHEQLQEEIADGHNRINLIGGRGDPNTYIVGDNREGKCGTGRVEMHMTKPTMLRKRFMDINCGYHHNAAIDEDGIIYTWGRSNHGQLGQGEVKNQSIPSLLAQPLTKMEISEVSCGWQHTLALSIQGFVFAWGLNINGQLGHGDYDDRNVPTLIESMIVNRVSKISAGHSHSALTDQNCTLYTWGANPDCRLCRKISYYKLSMRPKNTNKPTMCSVIKKDRIVGISLGADHSLFLREDGLVYACGNVSRGQLGDQYYHPEKAEHPYFPLYLFSTRGNKCIKVQAGDGFSVFLTEKGNVYSCGEGNYGRLGNENCTSSSKPLVIDYLHSNNIKIIDIQVGGRHTYAISKFGELYVWGFGYYYQLSNTTMEDNNEPTKVILKKQVEQISCGYFHSAFILGEDDVEIPENDKNDNSR